MSLTRSGVIDMFMETIVVISYFLDKCVFCSHMAWTKYLTNFFLLVSQSRVCANGRQLKIPVQELHPIHQSMAVKLCFNLQKSHFKIRVITNTILYFDPQHVLKSVLVSQTLLFKIFLSHSRNLNFRLHFPTLLIYIFFLRYQCH